MKISKSMRLHGRESLKTTKVKAESDDLNNTLSDLNQEDNIYQKQIAAIGANDINEYYHLQKEIDQLYFKQNGNKSSSGQDKFLKAEIKYIKTVFRLSSVVSILS